MRRDDFPALAHPGWTYLDSAATCLLHRDVLDATFEAMRIGGTAGRGSHRGGRAATELLERGRADVAAFLGARSEDVVFVGSATEGLNLVAHGWGRKNLLPSDRILVTALEHHANVLPWRAVARDTGARLETVPCDARGDLDLEALERLLRNRPRVLALTHVSNVSGACVDLDVVTRMYRARVPDGLVVVDGSQAVAHFPVAVEALGADFYVFSGHKAYGPLGAGVVWGRAEAWAGTDPLLWGGGMVEEVTSRGADLSDIPWRFEGGTPNHPAVAGLAAGLACCGRVDGSLATELARRLAGIDGVRVVGSPRRRVGVVSWVHEQVHPHDVTARLESADIAVRTGAVCAQPYLAALGVTAVVRASFGVYNGPSDVDRLVDVMESL